MPFPSLCSSTAEQPVDNRQTVEHHHAEGPFLLNRRWMAQTDERRIEDPQRWARYPLQRPFHCGIDVTVTCESSKRITSGQLPSATPNDFVLM